MEMDMEEVNKEVDRMMILPTRKLATNPVTHCGNWFSSVTLPASNSMKILDVVVMATAKGICAPLWII